MANEKAKCLICGKEYDVCKFCPTTVQYTPWRRECDTQKHYQIYLLVRSYDGGIVTKEEAYEQLINMRVPESEIKTFLPGVRKILNEIMQAKPQEEVEVEPVSYVQKKQKNSGKIMDK